MRKWSLAAGALAGAAGWTIYNGQAPKPQGFGKTFIGTPGHGKLMALTYDDGPNTAWTPALLDLLAKHDVKATFFSIGHYAREQPALLREVAAAGHAIGNHTYSHVTMPLPHGRDHPPRASLDDGGDRGRRRRDGARAGQTADATSVRRAADPGPSASSARRATCRSSGR